MLIEEDLSYSLSQGPESRGDASNRSLGGGHQPTEGTTRKAGPSSQARAEKRRSDPEGALYAQRLRATIISNYRQILQQLLKD